LVEIVDTSYVRFAQVIGALVAIITVDPQASLASLRRVADLQAVAGIAVIAAERLSVHAACCGVARFGPVADVTIATLQGRSPEAFPAYALVLGTAHVVVTAGEIIVRVHAPGLGRARVVGARISVVAIDCLPLSAHPLGADVVHRALVAVRAQPVVVGGREGAEAGRRVAGGGETRGIDAFGFGAYNHRIGLEHTLERNLFVVADQLARTEVLLERCAVCILQAVAGYGLAHAVPLYTVVA